MLTDEQFERTRRLALRLAGIELHDRHRELINRRARRHDIQDSTRFDALLAAAEHNDTEAGRHLIGLFTTNFTGFFRHAQHFGAAAEQAVLAVRRHGRARLWSAAAATGEEPYSLAMVLLETFGCDDPPTTILATDIDTEALAFARRGEYGEEALRALDPERRARFFAKTAAQHTELASAVRRLVKFRELNLVEVVWSVEGRFDVIFCRNVLMYLAAVCRQSVLERMASLLAPDGVLILDPVEHPGPAGQLFAPGKNGIYSLRSIAPTSATDGWCSTHRLKVPSL